MRIKELDGLRAAAVLGVLAYHFVPDAFPGGFIGVDLFFVISGFVITSGLLREEEGGSVSLSAFTIRRVFRILPPLLAMLLVTLLLVGWLGEFVPAAASFMNWHVAFGGAGGYFLHTWSLSAEEQFYLLWPLAFVALAPARRSAILLALIMAVTLWRVWLGASDTSAQRIYYGLDTHGDGLLLGCLLAIWRPSVPQWSWSLAGLLLLVLVFYSAPSPSPAWIAGFTLVALASAVLVLSCLHPPPLFSRLFASAPAQWIGLRSYSLYLWHFPVYAICSQRLDGVMLVLAALILTLTTATCSYRFIELPCTALGRRLAERRRPALA